MRRKVYNADSPPVIFSEMFDKNGNLQSVLQYRNPKEETKGYCFIPIWLIVSISIFYAFVQITLIAAVFLINFQTRPGLYKESCFGRSCIKNFGLICRNFTCDCPTDYVYINKCMAKKTFMEKCNSNMYCKDTMTCLNGVCSCNSSQYFNNYTCANIVSYKQSCKIDSQCDSRLILYCNTKYGMCLCNSSSR